MAVTRRQFLETGLSVSFVGLAPQGFGEFLTPTVPCKDDKPTPAARPDVPFSSGAPERIDIVRPAAGATALTITGFVVGLKCGGIKGARVDIWHADAKGAYPQGAAALRAFQVTDAKGKFVFGSVMPGAAAGKPRVLNIRVQTFTPAKAELTTVLFFPDDALKGKDPRFKPVLELKMSGAGTSQTGRFDVLLDLKLLHCREC